MTAEHTPTPWELDWESEGSDPAAYLVAGGEMLVDIRLAMRPAHTEDAKHWEIDQELTVANAEFVHRAVNSHDALLAAANKMISVIDAIAGVSDLDKLDIASMARLEQRWEKAPDALRQAIALATGNAEGVGS